ncbi:tonB-system energizer ExbB [Tianweitania sediminis]|uniref:Biopolymer transport protein ExbB n=1 Tax=Tianweitania sediminis TaxID=1502156 RepID=A0A8J7QX48_9HYPH|nr:tonB-system energizer ExbB [Tianweitania sediminis]
MVRRFIFASAVGYALLASLPVSAQSPLPAGVESQAAPPAASPGSETPAVSPASPATTGTDAPASPAVESEDSSAEGSLPLEPIDTGSRLTLPHDLSPWGMFMAADIVVKAVMLGLAFASLVTWTVWLAKSLELGAARLRAQKAAAAIGKSRTLEDAAQALPQAGGPAAAFVHAAVQEVSLSRNALHVAHGDGVKERVASVLSRIEAQAGRRMSRGTGVLATIGSTAPFVGLFGTVWGIMNSFIGISQAQTTNLAIVAPGIAEALLATAIGLVAAIPAVVIYNVFARSITGYRQVLADAAAGVERLVSRDLDFNAAAPLRRAAE